MKTGVMVAIGGALIGLAMLSATATPLIAQESASSQGTPAASHETMMQGEPGETGDAQMAEKMEQMMDECLAMMKMMTSMMGMMGGEDMQGMEGMDEMPAVSATPGA